MQRSNRARILTLPLAVLLVLLLTVPFSPALADTTVDLGSAAHFAVLAGSTLTNTGLTDITGSAGNIGVYPGSAIVGFPPGTYSGSVHASDAVAQQAQTDLTTAYLLVESLPSSSDLTGQDLGGLTLSPGVYFFASSAQLTGTLTLDAGGDPDAVFVFQVSSSLTTASTSSVLLIDGALAEHVFWQVGSSATLGTSTSFVGNLLALTSITATTVASVEGRLLARNGAVTLDTNALLSDAAPTPTAIPTATSSPAPTSTPSQEPNPGTSDSSSIPFFVGLALTGGSAFVLARKTRRSR